MTFLKTVIESQPTHRATLMCRQRNKLFFFLDVSMILVRLRFSVNFTAAKYNSITKYRTKNFRSITCVFIMSTKHEHDRTLSTLMITNTYLGFTFCLSHSLLEILLLKWKHRLFLNFFFDGTPWPKYMDFFRCCMLLLEVFIDIFK